MSSALTRDRKEHLAIRVLQDQPALRALQALQLPEPPALPDLLVLLALRGLQALQGLLEALVLREQRVLLAQLAPQDRLVLPALRVQLEILVLPDHKESKE